MMKRLATLLAVLAMVGLANADSDHSLGYSEETVMFPAQGDDCSDGVFICNHDGSCENGYCWDQGGTGPPYYGAFAEGYDLGAGTIVCSAYWLTQIGYVMGATLDAYVWDGGVSEEPGDVLCLVPGVLPENIPFWPECGQNDVEIGCCVSGEFTIGWWADWAPSWICQWYCCIDENGPAGYPWTCVLPDVGYPSGWQHLNVIWGSGVSTCIGVYFGDDPSPAESQTWGTIKALFE
jgi:hypothetical protein